MSYFIDNQLASAYGYNDREYMQGPFMEDKAEQRLSNSYATQRYFLEGVHCKVLKILILSMMSGDTGLIMV